MNPEKSNLGKISIGCIITATNNNGFNTMKIQSVHLKDVGGIQDLKLEKINPQMNIICGENGVGKTTLLDSIGHIFTNTHSNVIKKNIASIIGEIGANILLAPDQVQPVKFPLNNHKPNEGGYVGGMGYLSPKLLLLKVDRTFNYQMLGAISRDEVKNEHTTNQHSIHGIQYHDIKGWFIHRHLYSAHADALAFEQLSNFELAKKCFSILNKNFTFSRVDPNENEIMINTPSGEIYYEYLSSGFKSIISIVFGIIKEIELRFRSPFICAANFDGIIVIDEIELHLHPEWQSRACLVLKEIFPLAQFFITTHSPHVVQTAGKDEVIALERSEGKVLQRDLPTSEYGYQGWTIEEILDEVMGMPDLRTQKYNSIKKQFDEALDNFDHQAAKNAYDELDKMLHPQYPLRPVFKMQLDSLGE